MIQVTTMSNNKVRIRTGDNVIVLAGKDRGKIGKVLRVLPSSRQVAVEGVAVVKRHMKPVGDQQGGIVAKEALVDVSNVAWYDASLGRGVKLGIREVDGKRVRFNRKTGAVIDND